MRVLILADASFATRERALLLRLEVGLADEGVRVVHAIPRAAIQAPHADLFAQAVTYESAGAALTRRFRARQLLDRLDQLKPAGERAIDVIHIFGKGAWPLSRELVRATQAAPIYEVWCAGLLAPAARLLGAARTTPPPVCCVPDAALERALRNEDPGLAAAIRVTPWGVIAPTAPLQLLSPDRAPTAVLIGSGQNPQAFAAAIRALALAARQFPDLLIFADADAIARAQLFPLVQRLDLAERFTFVPDAEARREPILRCDLLILPEAAGEYRSLVLDAMASGTAILAAADPAVGWLLEGKTARLVDRQTPERWAAALAALLSDPAAARSLAASARDHVRQHHRASTYVSAVLDAYEWMTSAEAIPFNPPG